MCSEKARRSPRRASCWRGPRKSCSAMGSRCWESRHRTACERARPMTVLVVGSVALDSIETPFGRAERVLGGSATYFASAACHFAPVQFVGVVGDDYPMAQLAPLADHGVDLAGLERAQGESFHWRGRYRHDLNSAETLE